MLHVAWTVSMDCVSVCLSAGHMDVLCKNDRTNKDDIWAADSCALNGVKIRWIRWVHIFNTQHQLKGWHLTSWFSYFILQHNIKQIRITTV